MIRAALAFVLLFLSGCATLSGWWSDGGADQTAAGGRILGETIGGVAGYLITAVSSIVGSVWGTQKIRNKSRGREINTLLLKIERMEASLQSIAAEKELRGQQ